MEPTRIILNVDFIHITRLVIPWIENFQAEVFAPTIQGIIPPTYMQVRKNKFETVLTISASKSLKFENLRLVRLVRLERLEGS